MDISKFKIGEIHEVAINIDKFGNFTIEPFAIDLDKLKKRSKINCFLP